MERPGLISWVIPVSAAASAVITSWSKHNMELTLPWAVACYVFFGACAGGAFLWQYRSWKKYEAQKKDEKQREREQRLQDERDRNRQQEEMQIRTARLIRTDAANEERSTKEKAEREARLAWAYEILSQPISDEEREAYLSSPSVLLDPLDKERPEVRQALDELRSEMAAAKLTG
jgi:hypothetical protein